MIFLGRPSTRFGPYVHALLLDIGEGGAQADLDVLGRAFADEEVILLLDVGNNGLVEIVAGGTHRSRR